MSSSKVSAARGVASATKPVKTRKTRKPPVRSTRGRRSRKDTLDQAYPSPRRRTDTGAWVWSYPDPVTKEYRKNQLLLHPNGQRPLTAKEAEAAAKARWAELEADVVRAKHGLTLRKDFNPNDLIESFIDHQRSQSSRPDAEEQSIRRAFWILACARDLRNARIYRWCMARSPSVLQTICSNLHRR